MLEDMRLRNFSAGTQQSYIHHIKNFALHFGVSPERLGLDEIRTYQLHLIDVRKFSPATVNGFASAVKFLFTETLDMPWSADDIWRMRVPTKLPVVLSAAEVEGFLTHVDILQNRIVLMLCWGSGLRISEAVSLKITDIDSARMLIRVEQGKGAKDRYTLLSPRVLLILREYWKMNRSRSQTRRGMCRKISPSLEAGSLQAEASVGTRSASASIANPGRARDGNPRPTPHTRPSLVPLTVFANYGRGIATADARAIVRPARI